MKKVLAVVVSAVLVVAAIGVFAFWAIHTAQPVDTAAANTLPAKLPVNTAQQDLTFNGAVSGHMSNGHVGDNFVCSIGAVGPIIGDVNGADYTFYFRAPSAEAAGQTTGYVQIGPVANPNIFYGGDNVTLTIGEGGRTGSVTGDLRNLSATAQVTHISGSWTCPPND